ncbi:MAG: DUF302 domain-containing protein [Phycisphaerae bacterium]
MSPAPSRTTLLLAALVGLLIGAGPTAAAGWAVMPSMVLKVSPSRMGFDQTVATIEESIVRHGWVHTGIKDLQKSLIAQRVQYPYRVKLIELCKSEYAQSVLNSDRHVVTLMPCAIAVYEADDKQVMVSRINTGMMGMLMGGHIAEVMGKDVSCDEAAILEGILKG